MMSDTKVPELLPCPFCGCTTIELIVRDETTHWHVCTWCQAEGPVEAPYEDPPQGWNVRVVIAAGMVRGEGEVDAAEVRRDSPPVAKAQLLIPEGLIDALRAQQQADMDGTMVTVSRQALDEAIEILAAMQEGRE